MLPRVITSFALGALILSYCDHFFLDHDVICYNLPVAHVQPWWVPVQCGFASLLFVSLSLQLASSVWKVKTHPRVPLLPIAVLIAVLNLVLVCWTSSLAAPRSPLLSLAALLLWWFLLSRALWWIVGYSNSQQRIVGYSSSHQQIVRYSNSHQQHHLQLVRDDERASWRSWYLWFHVLVVVACVVHEVISVYLGNLSYSSCDGSSGGSGTSGTAGGSSSSSGGTGGSSGSGSFIGAVISGTAVPFWAPGIYLHAALAAWLLSLLVHSWP